MKKNKGVFITFEGPEGCGKSTHSKLLCRFLKNLGYGYVHTREPGGTDAGEKIREILLKSKDVNISDLAEIFLFEAARAQIVREIIQPALKKGKIVICDRFTDSTVAYQGYGGKAAAPQVIDKLNSIATGGLKPDLTVFLDLDTHTGLKRAKKKGTDRMEAKDLSYHKRVRKGYLELAKREPGRIKVIKVDDEIGKTQDKIRRIALSLIQKISVE